MMRRMTGLLILAALFLSGCASAAETALTAPKTIDTGVDPNAWALVPAGEFFYGRHAHETMVDYDYEIMVTHVTNAQFAAYLNQALQDGSIKIEGDAVVGYYPGDEFHAYEHEEVIAAGDWLHMPLDEPGLRLDYENGQFSAQEGYENHPMVHVTWFGAKAYCEYYDGRLPSEIEWEKAARGADLRAYPWGDTIEPGNANYYASKDPSESIFGKLGDTTPVGFYNGKTYDGYETIDSTSPYGLYDMAGNVWQWTGDVYDYQHYRYLRGGSKMNYEYFLRVWAKNSVGPDFHAPSAGFRCARDPVE